LKSYIKELTYKYFSNLSRDSLNNGGYLLQSLLNNKSFKKLFDHVKSNAIEYYLI